MHKRFDGKVVMITGAGGGFGARAAQRFAQEGASLIMSDLDKEALDKSVEQISQAGHVFAEPVDVTEFSEICDHISDGENFVGPIDIAINNAGIGQVPCPINETEESRYDHIMNVNAKSVFLCMKAQLPGMIGRGAGTILNVSSAAGLVGAGHISAYAASKHAVVGLTRSAADEVARYGIRINALCPSFAPTNLFNEMADEIALKRGEDRETAYRRITARVPMRRVAEIDEIVQAMIWAVDPDNSFMTGQALAIDGGLTAV